MLRVHRKLRSENEYIQEGAKTAKKKTHDELESKDKSKSSHITFDDLMGKFDQTANAPVTNVISKCLANPNKNTPPTILMTLGQSGSTAIWLMLSTLTNSKDYGQPIFF